jgi:hypothetical protein
MHNNFTGQLDTKKEAESERNSVYNLSLVSQKLMTKKYVTVDLALKNF